MIGTSHDLPRVTMVGYVSAPGEGFVADPQAALAGPCPQFAKVFRGTIDAAKRCRRHVRADEHQIGAERLHDVELAFGAVEGPGALRFRKAFKIPERLENGDAGARVPHHLPDLAGAGGIGEEVVLEDLDAVEARLADRLELLPQVAGKRYRRNARPQHPVDSAMAALRGGARFPRRNAINELV